MSFKDSLQALKDYDFNDLDLNNVGAWPALVKVVVAILLFLAILFAGYFVHVQGLQDNLEKRQAEESALKQEFELKVRQAALDAYQEQMVLMEASFDQLLRQLPSDTEVAGLLEDISSAGRRAGLEIEEIRLLSEVTKPFYIELPIQIKVMGGYHELAHFVSDVASLPRIVTLHDFQIEPDQGNVSRLVMSIQMKTYRYNSQRAAR